MNTQPASPETTSPQSWRFRAIAAILGIADDLLPKILRPKCDAASLLRAAKASPSPAAIQGLLQLVASLNTESELSLFGTMAARFDCLRLLRNAEQIETQHRQNPAIGQAAVSAPIFILGLPRSGTTFLHALMALDDANQVPRMWQTMYPSPRPPGFNPAQHRHVRIVENQLKFFAGLAPGFAQAHPVVADSPQECTEITSQVFQSLRFDTNFRVPSYQQWLINHGHREAFQFHKKFLQVLQHGIQSPRWVLKCPDHVFTIDAILQTYPDARFIVVHRDPMKVFASVAHLTEVLRRPFLKHVDPVEIGEQVTSRWIEGAHELIMFDQRTDIPPKAKQNIHYEELIADPLAALQKIYGNFGMELSNAAKNAVLASLAANPRGGYTGLRRYPLGHFNIRPERLA
ncbi:MAG TPA: sulfotransferase, partial [Acidocella sp.]|nr:sulfotransferase [Acidocella sp.]